jgi:site-specific recombinase XerD
MVFSLYSVGDFPEDLEDWWADYVRSLGRRGRSSQTIGAYRRAWARFWTWALAHGIEPDPKAVDAATVNAWVDDLRQHVSPATTAILWRNARPFFGWWAKETDTVNPFVKADTPSVSATLVPVVALDDIRKLLAVSAGKTFEDRRDTAIIMVLIDCGVRLGELVGLKKDDWDRRADTLLVNGKTGPRLMSHSAATGEALARYLRVRAMHPKAASEAMWLGRRGRLRDSGIGQLLARRCRQAGVARIHPHQLRHTWAHEAKRDGLGDSDLMVLAGWKTPAMAQRYGSSAAGQRARDAYRRRAVGDRL